MFCLIPSGSAAAGKGWSFVNITLLKEFTVLAQSETFLKAANTLFVSQPTLSRHIKNLEAELGVPLFERTTRRSKLTKYGYLLLPYAQQIIDLYSRFSTDLQEEKQEENSSLSISSIAAMDTYGITDMITRFKEKCGHVKVHLVPRNSGSFLEMLHSRTCELAFIREPMNTIDENVSRMTVTTDHFVAVVPISHPCARQKSLHLSDLRGQDIITLPEGTTIHQILCEGCEKEGFLPDLALTHHSIEHIFNCAKLGIGIAVLTDRLVAQECPLSEEVRVMEITPQLCTNINLCYSKSGHLSEAAQEFLEMFRTEFQPEGSLSPAEDSTAQ